MKKNCEDAWTIFCRLQDYFDGKDDLTDWEVSPDPEYGWVVDCRQEAYHDVYVYEDGYEEKRYIGD